MIVLSKVVWGLGRMLKHVRQVVMSSRYIPTDEKERIIKQYEDVIHTLYDVVQREKGVLPFTPEYKREIEKKRQKSAQMASSLT